MLGVFLLQHLADITPDMFVNTFIVVWFIITGHLINLILHGLYQKRKKMYIAFEMICFEFFSTFLKVENFHFDQELLRNKFSIYSKFSFTHLMIGTMFYTLYFGFMHFKPLPYSQGQALQNVFILEYDLLHVMMQDEFVQCTIRIFLEAIPFL